MEFNKKHLIILLIFVGALLVIGASCAQADSAVKVTNKKATVKIYNFKPGVLWGPKSLILKNGDAIAGYVEYILHGISEAELMETSNRTTQSLLK